MIEFNSIIPERIEALFANRRAFILCMIPYGIFIKNVGDQLE
jgi:hypothetical protein